MLCERLGSIDPETLASADLEPVFRTKPAIHRFPGAMATRVLIRNGLRLVGQDDLTWPEERHT